jgi:hypothetical protein
MLPPARTPAVEATAAGDEAVLVAPLGNPSLWLPLPLSLADAAGSEGHCCW